MAAVMPKDFGFPIRLRVATKLGFKSPKADRGHGGHQHQPRRLLGEPPLQLVQRDLTTTSKLLMWLGFHLSAAFSAASAFSESLGANARAKP